MSAALVIAVKVIAAPLVVRKRVPSNGAPPGSAINAAWPDDSIIGIGNVPIAAVSSSGSTAP